MNLNILKINFCAKPKNYAVIDNYVSRSAQPQKEDFVWLKEQGVTDVFNFRTMYKKAIDFDEEAEVKKLGMMYHPLPSKTAHPTEENIDKFLKEIDIIKKNNGKAHIHCKAGADRTGMYSFIYEMINGLGTLTENRAEWLKHGLHTDKYPKLMEWTEKFIKTKLR